MRDCSAYQEQLSALLDGELTEAEAAETEAHIAVCEDCRAMLEALRAVSSAVSAEPVPDGLHGKIMGRVQLSAKAARTQETLLRFRRWSGLAACFIVAAGVGFALLMLPGMGKAGSAADAAESYTMKASGAVASVTADSAAPEAAEEFRCTSAAVDAVSADSATAEEEPENYAMTYCNDTAGDDFAATGALDCAAAVILTVDAWETDGFLGTVTVPDDGGLLTPGTAVRVYFPTDASEVPSDDFPPGSELQVLFRDYNDAAEPLAILALELSEKEG